MKNLKFTERTNLNRVLVLFLGCLCLLFCFALSLIANHFHLLLKTGQIPIATVE